MVENIWSIICKDIIVDNRTNLTSYISCLEELTIQKFPVKIPFFSVGTLWGKTSDEPETLKVRVSMQDPLAVKKVVIESQDIKMNKPRYRANFVIGALPIEQKGKHHFVIEYLNKGKWNVAKIIPFDVKEKK